MLGCLVVGIQFNCFLKLVLGTLVISSTPQYQSPHDPILGTLWLLLDSFPYFLDGFDHISFFELGEGPVHVRVVILAIEFFGLPTDVQGFFVDHVHVEYEG